MCTHWRLYNTIGRRNRKRGIPDQLMYKDNRAKMIQPSLLPQTSEAEWMYISSGGSLSEPAIFGMDPLAFDDRKQDIGLLPLIPLRTCFMK